MSSRQKFVPLGHVYTTVPVSSCAGFGSHIRTVMSRRHFCNGAPISKVECHIRDRFCERLCCSVNSYLGQRDRTKYSGVRIGIYSKFSRPTAPAQCSMYVNDFLLFRVGSVHTTRKATMQYSINIALVWTRQPWGHQRTVLDQLKNKKLFTGTNG